jgi:hypothetical protein
MAAYKVLYLLQGKRFGWPKQNQMLRYNLQPAKPTQIASRGPILPNNILMEATEL